MIDMVLWMRSRSWPCAGPSTANALLITSRAVAESGSAGGEKPRRLFVLAFYDHEVSCFPSTLSGAPAPHVWLVLRF